MLKTRQDRAAKTLTELGGGESLRDIAEERCTAPGPSRNAARDRAACGVFRISELSGPQLEETDFGNTQPGGHVTYYMRAQPQDQQHPFAPVFNADSRILIVGSFPSVKSRQIGFYYGNPRNRFWPVMAALFEDPVLKTTEDRKQFALDRGIALFDVLASCEIAGSSDASIRKAVPNDFDIIFRTAQIRRVFANGRTAWSLFERYVSADVQYLPSTSPANAGWSFERLVEAWKVVREFLE